MSSNTNSLITNATAYTPQAPIQNIRRPHTGAIMECGNYIISIALLVIAGLTVGGLLPVAHAGGALIGIGAFLFLGNILSLVKMNYRAQQISSIIRSIAHALAIVMGSLALAGILPLHTVGIVVLVPLAVAYVARFGIDCCGGKGSDLKKYLFKKEITIKVI